MNTDEILESIKLSVRSARQHAYLGFYEESIQAFDKALKLVKMHSERLEDKALMNEWKSTENDLYNEMKDIINIKNIIQSKKTDSQNAEICEIHTGKSSSENSDPNQQNIAKHHPFGKKPFQKQPEFEEDEKAPNDNKAHYIYAKHLQQAKPGVQKDKDVCDPPSSRAKPKPVVKKPKPEAKKPEPIKKQKPAVGGGNKLRKNYEEPSRVAQKVPVQKGGAVNKLEKDAKKSFLHHCYPDGKGPDADLIQMLEKEVIDRNPNVHFKDIASLKEAKGILKQAVLLPLSCPELFVGIRRPWSGVLLFGPPGTGKTLLAKAVANLGKTTFFSITASSLASKWRGESEKLVRILFEMARFYAPTTIFCDEIDALGSKRGGSGEHETSRRVLSELLIQMDGMNTVTSANANEQANEEQKKTITVIGATNRPWDLDEAFRRRLEKRIYIPLPTEEGRKELFRINLKGIKLADDVDFPFLVKNTDGYSGADIASVCREAAMMPIRKKLLEGGGILNQLNDIEKLTSEMDVPITQKDFNNAIKNVRKSVSDTDLENYAKWMADFGAT